MTVLNAAEDKFLMHPVGCTVTFVHSRVRREKSLSPLRQMALPKTEKARNNDITQVFHNPLLSCEIRDGYEDKA